MSESNYGFEPTLDGLNTINADSSTVSNIVCDTIQINVSGTAPTMPPLNNTTNIATTAFVTAATSGFMDLTSTQTATGEKSFTNANTYISGNIKPNSVSTHSIQLQNGTFMFFDAENMAFTTTASLSFSAAAFWTAFCENNYYFQKSGIGNTVIIQDNGGVGNGQLYLHASNGGPNYIESYENLQLNTAAAKDILLQSGNDIYIIPASTATTYISTIASGNSPIIIGSSVSTTQTATHNAITTFTKIPSCAVAPTSGDHLCNKTYVDSLSVGSVTIGGTNAFTGFNSFDTNLPTSTVTPTTGTELTTKTYVDGAITSSSILGTANAFTNTNTFNSFLPTSTVTPTTATQLTTKTYVDSAITSSSILGTANAFTNTNTFNSFLPTSTVTPTTSAQLTTKTYVDGAITTAATGYAKLASANAFTATNTFTNTHDINITGGATTTIGNESASLPIVNINGTININGGATNVRNTNIGNLTGVTTVTGQATFLDNTQLGSTSADFIVPNGTLTKPFIIGTYASQSSFSLASITPVTTYLGGTIQTSASYGAVPSGSFKYLMVSIAPYNSSGGIALTAGTYMFWIGINFEDSSAFAMTDLRLGISNSSALTSGSTEATIIASLPNLTCYFHKTDAADAAGSDTEQRVLSGCFNLTAATTMYPFYGANHAAVTMDTISCDVVITKIGSA